MWPRCMPQPWLLVMLVCCALCCSPPSCIPILSLESTSTQVKFVFDGQRLQGNQTPEDMDMEDNDTIDAMIEQVRGWWKVKRLKKSVHTIVLQSTACTASVGFIQAALSPAAGATGCANATCPIVLHLCRLAAAAVARHTEAFANLYLLLLLSVTYVHLIPQCVHYLREWKVTERACGE